MIQNAMLRDRGTIPLVHDVTVLLRRLITASSQIDVSAEIFEASVYVLVLLRLEDQWNKLQLSHMKSALASQCERLSKLASNIADVTKIQEVAASAFDITTIGCLSFHLEMNFQRLLCQRLGGPLITMVAHLYINQKFESPASKTSLVLERVCEKFAHLLFWEKEVPKTPEKCKESIGKWILDLDERSLHPGQSKFFEKKFRKRNMPPKLVRLAEILFKSKDPAASDHRPAYLRPVASIHRP
jgi:hypothetical protein